MEAEADAVAGMGFCSRLSAKREAGRVEKKKEWPLFRIRVNAKYLRLWLIQELIFCC